VASGTLFRRGPRERRSQIPSPSTTTCPHRHVGRRRFRRGPTARIASPNGDDAVRTTPTSTSTHALPSRRTARRHLHKGPTTRRAIPQAVAQLTFCGTGLRATASALMLLLRAGGAAVEVTGWTSRRLVHLCPTRLACMRGGRARADNIYASTFRPSIAPSSFKTAEHIAQPRPDGKSFVYLHRATRRRTRCGARDHGRPRRRRSAVNDPRWRSSTAALEE